MTSWSFSFDSLGTPGHLRRSANGPASISWHIFQRLRWLVSSVDAVLFSNVHSKFTVSALGCSEETLFILLSKGVTGILRERTCLETWRKTQMNVLLWSATSCCRTSCVSVQPCTPKVLPNTETFLHSRVFFVTCVVPALCKIMYSLSVCSDGLFWRNSAAPRSFRQNRPPARTLSLTEWHSRLRMAFAAQNGIHGSEWHSRLVTHSAKFGAFGCFLHFLLISFFFFFFFFFFFDKYVTATPSLCTAFLCWQNKHRDLE